MLAQLLSRALVGITLGQKQIRRAIGGRGCRRGQQQIEQTLFRIEFRLIGHVFQFFLTHHVNGDLDQVANHGFDIPAHIAHFRKLRSFDLHERRVGKLGQAARNFRLAHTGRAYHDDVFGNDFFRQFGSQLLSTHAVAQGNGNGALGVRLANHVLIKFSNNLTRSKLIEREFLFFSSSREIKSHNKTPNNNYLSLHEGIQRKYLQRMQYSEHFILSVNLPQGRVSLAAPRWLHSCS